MPKPVGVSAGCAISETTGGGVTKADSGRGSSPTLSFSSKDGPPGYFETWSDERVSNLSKTERRVLAEILNCLADKEIAQKLGKSLRVVKSHASSIYRKTGLQGRIQIFRWYSELLRTRLSKR
jgi:DNA-binding NarL/FixJ family response regulator